MSIKFLVSLALTWWIAAFNFAGSGEREKMEALLSAYARYDLFSGTVLVAREGKILFSIALGEANKDFRVANNLETRFNIGSIGKTFTSVSIMQLVQKGKLALEPELEPAKEALNRVKAELGGS